MTILTLEQEFLRLHPEAGLSADTSPRIVNDRIAYYHGAISAALILAQSIEEEGIEGLMETLRSLAGEARSNLTSITIATGARPKIARGVH